MSRLFQRLNARRQLGVFRYDGFWPAMDTFKDKMALDSMRRRMALDALDAELARNLLKLFGCF